MIPFGEMIEKMKTLDENGHPPKFTIEVLTLDVKENTGGKILRYENVQLSGLKSSSTLLAKHKEKLQKIFTKNPHHFYNSTLNLFDPLTQEINTIHVRLITKFNGEKMIY